MIYVRSIDVPVSTVVEVFDELGISPGRFTVSLSFDGGDSGVLLQLAEDDSTDRLGTLIPSDLAEGNSLPLQFVTDRDPIYIANVGDNTGHLHVALTAI